MKKQISFARLPYEWGPKLFLREIEPVEIPGFVEEFFSDTPETLLVEYFLREFGSTQAWGGQTKNFDGKIIELFPVFLTVEPPVSAGDRPSIFIKRRLISWEFFRKQYPKIKDPYSFDGLVAMTDLALRHGVQQFKRDFTEMRRESFGDGKIFVLGLAGFTFREGER